MGQTEPVEEPDADEQDDEPAPKKKTPWWAYAVVVGVIAVIGLCVAKQGSSDPSAEDVRADARRACQEDFVPKRLKAPATAQFTGVSVDFDGTAYTVTGQVDSQNTFGALVRARFTCVVHSANDRWVLDSASVDG